MELFDVKHHRVPAPVRTDAGVLEERLVEAVSQLATNLVHSGL